jgi:hypothetical protein
MLTIFRPLRPAWLIVLARRTRPIGSHFLVEGLPDATCHAGLPPVPEVVGDA